MAKFGSSDSGMKKPLRYANIRAVTASRSVHPWVPAGTEQMTFINSAIMTDITNPNNTPDMLSRICGAPLKTDRIDRVI